MTNKEYIDKLLALPVFHLYKRISANEIKAPMELTVAGEKKDVLTEVEFMKFFGKKSEPYAKMETWENYS